MGMGTYILRRVFQSIALVFVILTINFTIINLAPGSPVIFMAGQFGMASKEYVEAVIKRWGLDKPLWERLLIYFANLLRGDLGYSYRYLAPVSDLILERLPITLFLTVTSAVLAFIIGSTLGLYAARHVGRKVDAALTTTMFVFWSTPSFWLGIILMIVFGIQLRILPVSGMINVRAGYTGVMYYLDIAYHAILPITTLTLIMMPQYFKITRDAVLHQLKEDYVITFRAIGLRENELFRRHIFRNAILPPVTIFGLQLGYAAAGAVLIENVFGWPGMGRLLLDSILTRDYPVIMGIYLMISITVVFSILIVDLLYMLLDPRIRYR